jgi:hypothetical protein
MISRYLIGIAIVWNGAFLSKGEAAENVPEVSKGAREFHQIVQSGEFTNITPKIKECWETFGVKKTQGSAARCFAIDYTAYLFDDFVAKKSGTIGSEFLRIEKVLTRVNRALQDLKIEQKERGVLIADWTTVSESEAVRLANQRISNSTSNTDLDKELFGKARSAISAVLKNGSARFGPLVRVTVPNQNGVPTDVVCGKVDVMNQIGNYVGYRSFVYFIGDGTAYYDRRIENAEDMGGEVVKNFCVE